MKKLKITFALGLFLLGLVSVNAQDEIEKNPILTSKFQFEVGTFFPSKTIDIEVDGAGPNDKIEFGKAFGLESTQTTLLMGFDWRFSKKWKVAFEYFGLKNSNTRTLEEDISWEDFTFEAGTNVKGGINFSIYRVYVGRIFTEGQKHEFGGGLGVHAMNVRVSLEGDVLTNQGDLGFEKSRKSITIPLPNLGLWYFYAPLTKLAFTARVDFFALSINEFSGNLWNVTPGVNYQVFKHVGVAANYRWVNIGAEYDTSNWNGSVDIIFQGPSISITGNF